MNSGDVLAVQDVKMAYGERIVLDIDALSFERGARVALIGPNGAGKSTLLRILAGQSAPTQGSVLRGNAHIGYLPQKSYVFDFSVRKNIEIVFDGAGYSKKERAARALDALEQVGMADFAEARGSSLSGGEAQRVALARMIAMERDVLLLDEPTASMDVRGTILVEHALSAYAQQTGCTLIISTHAPAQAARVSSRTICLFDGRIAEDGRTDSVLSSPQDARTREFLAYWQVTGYGPANIAGPVTGRGA